MNDDNFDTQTYRVYDWLMEGKSITTYGAVNGMYICSLTKRISELVNIYRVPIIKKWVRNSSGKGRHMVYSIDAANREILKDVNLMRVSDYSDLLTY